MSSTPLIRFSIYTDDWEQRKLGEVGTTYPGLSGKSKEDFGHGSAKFVTYMNVYSNAVADATMVEPIEIDCKQKEVEAGDVFFTTSSETPDEVGMSSVLLEKQGPTYLNSFCFGYRPTRKFDPYYLAYMLRSEAVRKNIILLAQGISRYNISKAKMMDIGISVPSLPEQEQIGLYFKNLENLITLHQRKYDKLIALKAACLDKMFPKSGSKVPEMRFAGFTGDWKQRKLGNLLSFQNGFNGSSDAFGSGTPLISVLDILDSGFITHDSIRGRARLKEDERKRYSVEYGDVLFQRSSENFDDAGTSNVYLDNEKPASFGGFVIRGKKKSDYNPIFFKYLLDSSPVRAQITRRAQGAQHINVSQNTLSDVIVYMPDDEEQNLIGSIVRKIDNLITLHQRKLDKLRQFKEAMLHEMFV